MVAICILTRYRVEYILANNVVKYEDTINYSTALFVNCAYFVSYQIYILVVVGT